jgi:hypothetical protein
MEAQETRLKQAEEEDEDVRMWLVISLSRANKSMYT